jgi:hypothetical protein
MPTPTPANIETKTAVTLTQRIALGFVVTVGLVVVGSAMFAAAITWTRRDATPTTTVSTSTPSTGAVLGVDHTFDIPAE